MTEIIGLDVGQASDQILTTRFQADLNAAESIDINYTDLDIMCLEMLRLSDQSTGLVYNIVQDRDLTGFLKDFEIFLVWKDFGKNSEQDYDPKAYDVNSGDPGWTSQTGAKIVYFSSDCNEDWRAASKVRLD